MNPDDPKFTAYALDELDPAERAEVEQLLRDHPDALAEVEETERLAAQLRRELHAEPALPLTAEQRGEVLAIAGAAPLPKATETAEEAVPANERSVELAAPGRYRSWQRGLALAASMAVFGGVAFFAFQANRKELTHRHVADALSAPDVEPLASPTGPDLQTASPAPAAQYTFSDSLGLKQEGGILVMELPSKDSQLDLASTKVLAESAPTDPLGSVAANNPVPGRELAANPKKQPSAGDLVAGQDAPRFGLATKRVGEVPMASGSGELTLRETVGGRKEQKSSEQAKEKTLNLGGMTAATAPGVPALPAAASASEAKNFAFGGQGPAVNESGARPEQIAPQAAPAPQAPTEPAGSSKLNFLSDASGLALSQRGAVEKPASPRTATIGNGYAVITGGTVTKAKEDAMQLDIDGSTTSLSSVTVTTAPAPAEAQPTGLGRAEPGGEGRLAGPSVSAGDRARRMATPSAKPASAAAPALRGEYDVLSAPAGDGKDRYNLGLAAQTREIRELQDRMERSLPDAGTGNLEQVVEKLAKLKQEVRELEVAQKAIDDVRRQSEPSNTESYDTIKDNAFLGVGENPLSTFSIDVDTASYSNVRRFLNEQRLPPKGAVRIEELLNYFDYDYPQPDGEAPFSASMEVAACPWQPEHRLVRIGLKGRDIHPDKRPASNLVFLVDVSGSMQPENKLPLVKKCLRQLVDRLNGEDTVSIAVYAGASGCVLEPTNKKSEMRAAIDRLESGGSTNGASGIQLAYQLAERNFMKGGVNRVILATDGDFNVGVTNQSELVEIIEKKAKTGVFLTVLGFGMGNLKDSTLEKLADKGNGNYAYIDTLLEGRKVLVEQMSGTLVTIAKDVKIQVEFNPSKVSSYRLIGYENRMLKKEDFNDDTKDAGEIGAGHTVTALYEVVPAGKLAPGAPAVDSLKYQRAAGETTTSAEDGVRTTDALAGTASRRGLGEAASGETLTLKLRYKAPDGDTSKLLEFPLTDDGKSYERSSRDFRFAAAVASFGMLLRDSPHKGGANWSSTLELALEGKGEDRTGYRGEFVSLIERAKAASR